MVLSKPGSQWCLSKEPPPHPGHQWEQGVSPQTSVKAELPALTGEWPAEAPVPEAKVDCQPCPRGADSSCGAGVGQLVPQGDTAMELCDMSSVAVAQTAREGQEPPKRASTSTGKAAGTRDPALLQDHSPQGPEKELLQDSDGQTTPERPKPCRLSGRRSLVGGPHRSRRASLVVKYSLTGRRESALRRSVSRAISKKATARESSSASSRASCEFPSLPSFGSASLSAPLWAGSGCGAARPR